jgi:hypothetical protein
MLQLAIVHFFKRSCSPSRSCFQLRRKKKKRIFGICYSEMLSLCDGLACALIFISVTLYMGKIGVLFPTWKECDTCQRIMAFLYAEMWNELIFFWFGKCLSIIGCKMPFSIQ